MLHIPKDRPRKRAIMLPVLLGLTLLLFVLLLVPLQGEPKGAPVVATD